MLGLAYQTAWCGLVHRAALRPARDAPGPRRRGRQPGLAAVQLGRALGARVIATAGSAPKLEVARAPTAPTSASTTGAEAWVERVRRETHGAGADVIFDPVGGDVFDGSTGVPRLRGAAARDRLRRRSHRRGRHQPHPAEELQRSRRHWGLYRQARRGDGAALDGGAPEARRDARDQARPLCGRSGSSRRRRPWPRSASRESYGKVVLVP